MLDDVSELFHLVRLSFVVHFISLSFVVHLDLPVLDGNLKHSPICSRSEVVVVLGGALDRHRAYIGYLG